MMDKAMERLAAHVKQYTTDNESLIWKDQWPGKLLGGKTHIFYNVLDPFGDPPQWYDKDLPANRRGRAVSICCYYPGVVGLQVIPVDWEQLDCKRCIKMLRNYLLWRLKQ